MKSEETPEPSSIIVEMLRASDYNTEERITTFAKAIFHRKRIPDDWQEMIKKTAILWKLWLNLLQVLGIIKQLHLFNLPICLDLENMKKEKSYILTE